MVVERYSTYCTAPKRRALTDVSYASSLVSWAGGAPPDEGARAAQNHTARKTHTLAAPRRRNNCVDTSIDEKRGAGASVTCSGFAVALHLVGQGRRGNAGSSCAPGGHRGSR